MTSPASARLGGQGLLAAAGVVAAVTLVSRAVGLARWGAFSHAVGATCVGEVYATANTVPNVLFEIAAGGALAAVAVPLVARHLHRGNDELADRTASALLSWALLVLLPLTLLLALAAGPITALLLGGGGLDRGCEPAAAQAAGRVMLLLFAPQVALYGVGIVLTGVLQAHRRFFAAALAPLLSSLVVIAVYLAFGALYEPDQDLALSDLPTSALVLLAGGTTLGVVALSLPLLVPAVRLGIRWRPTLRFPGGSGRLAGALAGAGVLGVGAQQLFVVVVILLTNRTGVAGIAVWNYAQTIYLLPYAVLVVPLATAAFPRLTDEPERAVATLRRALTASVVAAVAGAAVLVATRHDVGTVFLALDRGSGGAGRASLEALPPTLALLAPGLVGFALLAVLTRALYAAHRPWDAAAGTVLGWAVAALLPLAVVPVLLARDGTIREVLAMLAAASSVGMGVAAGILLARTRRVWGAPALAGAGRAGLAALAGAAVVVLARELLATTWVPTQWPGALLAGTLTGAAVLVVVAAALRVLAPKSFDQVRARVAARRERTRERVGPGGVR
ncbi:murein biosynthesis integral membrane protein MurJ [Ornithinimicrobium pratense]|uniref:murein biosynthesis integral membrane protein MurJ n=1 Tax=Ornithinimicrobium pratense TaxID=2593973 RepID=UPI00178886DD|nr:lipid II flippase MurJ [Ornithinimicrobium pratense]